MSKILSYSLLVLLSLTGFIIFQNSLQLLLIHHIQQPVFLCTKEYFLSFLTYPGGIAEYISLFLMQFFEFKIYGALVVALLMVVLFAFSSGILSHMKDRISKNIICLLPSLIFPFLLADSRFPVTSVIALIVVLSGILVFKYTITKKSVSYISIIVFPALIYFLAGSGYFWLFVISALLLAFTIVSVKTVLIKGGIFLLISAVIPFLAFSYIFNINDHQAYLSFLPDVPVHLRYQIDWPFKLFIISVPLILFLALVLKKTTEFSVQKLAKKAFIPVLVIILAAPVLLYFHNGKEPDQRFARVSYYNSLGEWQKMEEEIMNSDEFDFRLSYYFVRSINKQGKFLEKFFNFPQYLGSDVLYPDKVTSGSTAMLSSDYYFDLGYISESMHWAYEAQSIMPNSRKILERLVETNYIAGNYEGARTFFRVLERNLFKNEFIYKYQSLLEDTNLADKDAMILLKRKQMPDESVIPDEISHKLRMLLKQDSSNRMAYEHLQMHYLLNHQAGDFVNTYNNYPHFQTDQLPDIFAQAIVIYLMETKKDEFHKYPISEASKKKILSYMKTLKSFQGNKGQAKNSLISAHSDSYLFYLNYDSPIVTKVGLKTREVREYQN